MDAREKLFYWLFQQHAERLQALVAGLLRLNAETGRLLQQHDRQGRPIRHWQVEVICPSRDLNFCDPTPAQEFVERLVLWIELAPER